MFDVGFWELLVMAVIGLLVLGPQRLPRVVRQLGRWLAAARRTAAQLRWQIEREIDLGEHREPEASRASAGDAPGATGEPAAKRPEGGTGQAPETAPAAGDERTDRQAQATDAPPDDRARDGPPDRGSRRTLEVEGEAAGPLGKPPEGEPDPGETETPGPPRKPAP